MDSTHILTLVSRPGAGPMGAFYITIAELVAQLGPEELEAITKAADEA